MSQMGRIVLALAAPAVMLLAGCALGPSRLDADYGRSINLAKSSQTLDSAAQQNLAPVYGFDGGAAQANIDRYRSAFEKPAPAPTFVIPVNQAR